MKRVKFTNCNIFPQNNGNSLYLSIYLLSLAYRRLAFMYFLYPLYSSWGTKVNLFCRINCVFHFGILYHNIGFALLYYLQFFFNRVCSRTFHQSSSSDCKSPPPFSALSSSVMLLFMRSTKLTKAFVWAPLGVHIARLFVIGA